MRFFLTILLLSITVLPASTHAIADNTASIIIEVEGDPSEHKKYLEVYHPYIDVIATYETLFNGLALQATPKKLEKMESLEFIKAIHPVTTYQTQYELLKEKTKNAVMPASLNDTTYTGKGVQVAVVDTGIDYDHSDLASNYVAGFDLVDLDDDPMETIQSQGMPTLHGTHVAGIIAANGDLEGVAPQVDLYAYRALGPGGRGTSVQVIAALEQAVDDGADIINLSLGNSVNGPDFPTSVAVNRAVELGVAVVIANGNNGPGDWTVGSPATATNALSVGATANPQTVPYLLETLEDKKIKLTQMAGSTPWNFSTDYKIAQLTSKNIKGKIAFSSRGKTPFHKKAKMAQDAGAIALLISNNEPGIFQGSVENAEDPIQIPVAAISKQDGEWLEQYTKGKTVYMESNYEKSKLAIADFSSRGPVTVNWDLKPEVSAPGTNILSTVPGGYQELQGTSMAAPHVTGAMALLKEAHPDWTIKQLTGALKTTASRINTNQSIPFKPNIQGMGEIQPQKAINTPTIIHNPLLSFRKVTDYKETKKIELTIENNSKQVQTYAFNIPKQQKGLRWNLPQTFTIPAGETRKIPVELSVNSTLLEKGLHQGWLTLKQGKELYHLPYLFVNETADYPKAMGFEFSLKPFSDDQFVYQLYLTDPAKSVDVKLYNPETLIFDRQFLQTEEVQVGMNEGYLKESELGKPGRYLAIITVHLENGKLDSYQTVIYIQ
ncbi:minor extracellular serine protease Vpr [Virgibacillus subterraneus]|uniref:Minor extracellular serine protease Vpr n=1 Tax=Virgibacillus subterraneus TaxID=621109 RepID=A0A1H9A8J7_9BACI|nr:S8 family serine peptidase [Virgibacillus subterraneus]SEP73086.1 minor extracellular serine protease Vpr [Virgibacillus subterraneus]